jgi:hypothetical protein
MNDTLTGFLLALVFVARMLGSLWFYLT